ncbi:hypothetical protein, partial [Vibrio anguillarum]|uniref:hypothetical protein n=1 Tax=Vibrio anguillarum TaxID=55601 RepID=UPI001A7E1936
MKEANLFLFGNENLPLPNATKPRITARPLMWSVKSQIVKEANPFLFGNENLPLPNATKPRITARLLKMVGEEGFE